MNTTAKETLAETELDLKARVEYGRELQVADLVYLVDDPRKDLGHVANIVGGRLYVAWPRGKHLLHASADLVLVAS